MVFENIDKTKEIIVDRHFRSHSDAQELKIDHKTFLNHLLEEGFKKKLDVWVDTKKYDGFLYLRRLDQTD